MLRAAAGASHRRLDMDGVEHSHAERMYERARESSRLSRLKRQRTDFASQTSDL